MADVRAQRAGEDDAPDTGAPADALDIEGLKLRGDVGGLLDLAKAYRSSRELKKCYEAYVAAAEMGSADAEYAVALFSMSGGVVDRDLKEGAMRLRAAADKGSLPAKVYLGNLYELGIHYKADPEKADVWYRNAARASNVIDEPGTPAHARALAELGCVRYALQLVEAGGLSEDDKTRLLQRARAHGYGLKRDEDLAESRRSVTAEPQPAREDAAEKPAPAGEAKATGEKPKPSRDGEKTSLSAALAAFGYAVLFAAAGLGAGYAGMHGARELVAHGGSLPGLGTRTDLVFPIVLGIVGVLPNVLTYRFGTVLKALVAGGALGGVGWVAWGTGQAMIHTNRSAQAIAFGVAGLLAALFVLGLLGGTKRSPRPRVSR